MNICGNCFNEYEGAQCPHCGYSTASDAEKFPQALKPGTVLSGRYIAGRVLGEGGFGITYKAMDYETKQLVAIKEFFPSSVVLRGNGSQIRIINDGMSADFENNKKKFLAEARTLSQLNGTENICDIYSYFEENGTAYFAMEYVDGLPLDEYMNKLGRTLDFEEVKSIILPIMKALGRVHEKSIIHRDISPDNIIVKSDGTAMLIDFGAARYIEGELAKSLTVVLKYGFAPKEQYARHGNQGPYTDIYAMAATIYYALTGQNPPEAFDRVGKDSLLSPRQLGKNIPYGADQALLKGLALDAENRWQSMGEFMDGLLSSQIFEEPAPTVRTKAVSGFNPKLIIGGGAALAAIVALVLVFSSGSKNSGKAEPAAPAAEAVIAQPEAADTQPEAVPAEPEAVPFSWEIREDTLYIEGDIPDFPDEESAPWMANDADMSIKKVVLADSVTHIGDFAFSGMMSIRDITIPNSVTSIGDRAFYFCYFDSITLPDSVKKIGVEAFSNCLGLTEITIPDSVTSIGEGAFSNCGSLETARLSASLETIGNKAFQYSFELNSVYIPVSVTKIEGDAFYFCTALTDIYYAGTEEQWNNIDIVKPLAVIVMDGVSSYFMDNATVHFNS